ncbi:DUF1127 domain-containing protein [Vibrio gazogenes]|jgi:hypothetical protein|uniref:DUF1127 domain-containing protein n=1 Tax=Vibrio gazogenes DSM 21264 = NBRC 103151 TaxID=1123492 RepID=A0A1M5E6U6_VIBGA|nr:DUF1127 domain-containing protein [Vibrio gazogenes]USP14318.1 DUF1127 domain-containing protein [Vibrio gazogenes]SHF74910.1 hypothetical protein SAMN02745781_03074 [Vibrio gazogenes DSM 21264] [Vibrio gazogenes DSM 21264 = NBRC 103151]
MRHSLYLSLAAWLIRADLRREERVWRRKVSRSAYDIPWDNPYLLRDIGLEADGRPFGRSINEDQRVARRMHLLSQFISLRIPT